MTDSNVSQWTQRPEVKFALAELGSVLDVNLQELAERQEREGRTQAEFSSWLRQTIAKAGSK